MKGSSGVPFSVGAILSAVVGVQAWRRAGNGGGLGAALRPTACVSFGFFAVSLIASWGPTNRRARSAFGGSHLTHALLIARYLGRHERRDPTGPGSLPALIELPGGVLGYVMVAVMVKNALDDQPPGAVDDLACGYLAALFGFDFLNAATRKGSSGRRRGVPLLAGLVLAVVRRWGMTDAAARSTGTRRCGHVTARLSPSVLRHRG